MAPSESSPIPFEVREDPVLLACYNAIEGKGIEGLSVSELCKTLLTEKKLPWTNAVTAHKSVSEELSSCPHFMRFGQRYTLLSIVNAEVQQKTARLKSSHDEPTNKIEKRRVCPKMDYSADSEGGEFHLQTPDKNNEGQRTRAGKQDNMGSQRLDMDQAVSQNEGVGRKSLNVEEELLKLKKDLARVEEMQQMQQNAGLQRQPAFGETPMTAHHFSVNNLNRGSPLMEENKMVLTSEAGAERSPFRLFGWSIPVDLNRPPDEVGIQESSGRPRSRPVLQTFLPHHGHQQIDSEAEQLEMVSNDAHAGHQHAESLFVTPTRQLQRPSAPSKAQSKDIAKSDALGLLQGYESEEETGSEQSLSDRENRAGSKANAEVGRDEEEMCRNSNTRWSCPNKAAEGFLSCVRCLGSERGKGSLPTKRRREAESLAKKQLEVQGAAAKCTTRLGDWRCPNNAADNLLCCQSCQERTKRLKVSVAISAERFRQEGSEVSEPSEEEEEYAECEMCRAQTAAGRKRCERHRYVRKQKLGKVLGKEAFEEDSDSDEESGECNVCGAHTAAGRKRCDSHRYVRKQKELEEIASENSDGEEEESGECDVCGEPIRGGRKRCEEHRYVKKGRKLRKGAQGSTKDVFKQKDSPACRNCGVGISAGRKVCSKCSPWGLHKTRRDAESNISKKDASEKDEQDLPACKMCGADVPVGRKVCDEHSSWGKGKRKRKDEASSEESADEASEDSASEEESASRKESSEEESSEEESVPVLKAGGRKERCGQMASKISIGTKRKQSAAQTGKTFGEEPRKAADDIKRCKKCFVPFSGTEEYCFLHMPKKGEGKAAAKEPPRQIFRGKMFETFSSSFAAKAVLEKKKGKGSDKTAAKTGGQKGLEKRQMLSEAGRKEAVTKRGGAAGEKRGGGIEASKTTAKKKVTCTKGWMAKKIVSPGGPAEPRNKGVRELKGLLPAAGAQWFGSKVAEKVASKISARYRAEREVRAKKVAEKQASESDSDDFVCEVLPPGTSGNVTSAQKKQCCERVSKDGVVTWQCAERVEPGRSKCRKHFEMRRKYKLKNKAEEAGGKEGAYIGSAEAAKTGGGRCSERKSENGRVTWQCPERAVGGKVVCEKHGAMRRVYAVRQAEKLKAVRASRHGKGAAHVKSLGKAKKERAPPQCSQFNTKNGRVAWRCSEKAMEGRKMCEKHGNAWRKENHLQGTGKLDEEQAVKAVAKRNDVAPQCSRFNSKDGKVVWVCPERAMDGRKHSWRRQEYLRKKRKLDAEQLLKANVKERVEPASKGRTETESLRCTHKNRKNGVIKWQCSKPPIEGRVVCQDHAAIRDEAERRRVRPGSQKQLGTRIKMGLQKRALPGEPREKVAKRCTQHTVSYGEERWRCTKKAEPGNEKCAKHLALDAERRKKYARLKAQLGSTGQTRLPVAKAFRGAEVASKAQRCDFASASWQCKRNAEPGQQKCAQHIAKRKRDADKARERYRLKASGEGASKGAQLDGGAKRKAEKKPAEQPRKLQKGSAAKDSGKKSENESGLFSPSENNQADDNAVFFGGVALNPR